MRRSFPKTGLDWTDIHQYLSEARKDDVDWRGGKITGLVYFAGDDVMQVAKDAYTMFFAENAVYPAVYPSMSTLESEVVDLTLELLHGDEFAAGSMSTGGTESIFLAVKAARDWARANRPLEGTLEIVAPGTAHPAFNRAAGYLDMKIVRVPQGPDFRADVNAMAEAITQNTIMLVGSAPQYPHGVIDPIRELGDLALARDLWLHVDACIGGFMAPFVRKLGYPVPDFDFAVPGVTSISADIHKNGYSAKGASTVLYRDSDHFKYQGFEFDEWARGRYATNTFMGSRPGGAVASAWAVMNYLGEEGYMRVAREVMQIKEALMEGVNRIDGLETFGDPELTIFTFGSTQFDIFAVADGLSEAGWLVNRIQEPLGIHLMLSLIQKPVLEEYLSDLTYVVEEVKVGKTTRGKREVSY